MKSHLPFEALRFKNDICIRIPLYMNGGAFRDKELRKQTFVASINVVVGFLDAAKMRLSSLFHGLTLLPGSTQSSACAGDLVNNRITSLGMSKRLLILPPTCLASYIFTGVG